MSLLPADDSRNDQSFLPVPSSLQRRGGSVGVSGRRRGPQTDDFDAELFQDADVVEIRPEENAARLRNRRTTFDPNSDFNFFERRSRNNFQGFGAAGGSGRTATNDNETAAAIYEENRDSVNQPFFLGSSVDLVG